MPTITIDTTDIKIRIVEALNTALGPFTPRDAGIITETDAERGFATASDLARPEGQCLIIWGMPTNTGRWAPMCETWEYPVDIYVFTKLGETDGQIGLDGYLDAVMNELDKLGHRWSGVADMHDCYYEAFGGDHEYEASWRDAGWLTGLIRLKLRFDYLTR